MTACPRCGGASSPDDARCRACGEILSMARVAGADTVFFAEPVDGTGVDDAATDELEAPEKTILLHVARPPDAEPLELIDEYQLLEKMGAGGMGTVYKAFHIRLHKVVAIKLLHRAEETALRRFAREMTLQARLSHPNICPVTDSGVSSAGRDYLVMDFIPGRPLSKMLGAPELTLERLASIMARVARALHYAHERGVLHRDIKPDNVIVDDAGEPHVVDFGIARELSSATPLTAAGVAVGTPYYMAPEQIRCMNDLLGPRTDIYGLGAVLFHAVSGAPPFRGGTHLDTLRRALSDPVPPLRTPGGTPAPSDLEGIVRKAMARDPEDRYATAAALACDLSAFAAGEPTGLRPQRRLERTRWFLRRNSRVIRFSTAAVLTLGAAVGGVTAVALGGDGSGATVVFSACMAVGLGGGGLVLLVRRLVAVSPGRRGG